MGAPLVSGAVDINQGRSVVFSRKRSTIKWLKIYKQTKRREVQGGPPPLLLLLLHLQRNQKRTGAGQESSGKLSCMPGAKCTASPSNQQKMDVNSIHARFKLPQTCEP